MIGRGLVAVAWLSAASLAAAQPAERAQTILHMLDYEAVDYPEFVRDGVHPSLQGLLLQAALVLIIVAGFAYTQRAARHP